ncbi:MAG: alpha-galactosidase [Bacteroidales bacterium]|nr:alpha-galactosidase [Bacteroidales bacterium]
MKKFFSLLVLAIFALAAHAEDYVISTKNTTMVLSGKKGERLNFVYYGPTAPIDEIRATGNAVNWGAYPTFGTHCTAEHAMLVTHPSGDNSLELAIEEVKQYKENEANVTEFVMKDKVFPFYVSVLYKAIPDVDVIKVSTVITNKEKKAVTLNRFASAYLPMKSNELWLSYLVGGWGAECQLVEEPIHRGRKVVGNHDGARTSFVTHPSFMISRGEPNEHCGFVVGGTLLWTGNYELSFLNESNSNYLEIVAGINPEASAYTLEPKETFTTPELVLTCSTEGKGGVSRNFHRWGRKYQIIGGTQERDILLNSWEGVYFRVNQEGMDQMMKEFSAIGGELFVMDDGWFGDKYPRDNGETSLGDWMVCKKKLPQGVEGLIESSKKFGIKFGIWIEPEMTNSKSELYEKHPDWILRQEGREPVMGRGGTQLMLDMTNPEVQEHVFKVVDDLMQANPEIYYMKWDANFSIENAASLYLPKKKQSHLYIEYHRGLIKTLERIRAKYPDLVIQLCASGGGRLNYAYFPYFNECWTSDNTDAIQRLFIQWGVSQYYPSNVMAAHVSASPNHQTKRVTPLKFRFDVAMTGRLGMEMKPSDLTEKEKEFAKNAIATYKNIRPVIQQGDLYRLISPYEKKPYVSVMYVTPEKDRAVYFLYRTQYVRSYPAESRILKGLDPDKKYMFRELNKENPKRNSSLEGKVISGKTLMTQGFYLNIEKELGSAVYELIAQ